MESNPVPTTMHAVIIREHGGPEVLKIENIPTPLPSPGEVLIKVEATALSAGSHEQCLICKKHRYKTHFLRLVTMLSLQITFK